MNQNDTSNRYILWQLVHIERDRPHHGLLIPSEGEVHTQFLGRSVKLPNLATLKDFLHFYIATSQPRFASKTTTDPIGTVTEWFFTGFTRITGTVSLMTCGRRSTKYVFPSIYAYLKRTLVASSGSTKSSPRRALLHPAPSSLLFRS